MDCIQSIQKAIEFMEDHILEDISYEDAARQVYMSNHHFHRLFSMLTGITANQYIRSRKLSMAGQELVMSDKRVIDLAYKYGYESPESFTKAFTRFHGISPIAAKQTGSQLQSFSRLVIKLKLEGGMVMEYKIQNRDKFQLLAKVQSLKMEKNSEDRSPGIMDFWTKCGTDEIFETLKKYTTKHDIYGTCAPGSKETQLFEYGIAMEYEGGPIPDGYRIIDIKPSLWAVFQCIGDNGKCIEDTWTRIYREFLPSSDYNLRDDIDFELYSENGDEQLFCEIWLPVDKK